MNYLTANWGHPWIAIAACVVLAVHERGLRRINRRSTVDHARRRREKLWLSYAGIVVVTLSIVSPLQYWSMEYFWVHMIQHVTVMLAAPALYVAGAPAIPLLHALPVQLRRRLLRRAFLQPTRHPLRASGSWLLSPVVGVTAIIVVMVFWMIPRLFNVVMENPELHINLMLSTFFLSGILFWVQFIPSHPFRPTMTPFAKIATLLLTNLIMTVIAMSLSFFASGPFYDLGNSMLRLPGMGSMIPTTLNPLADQQIGAAILWVCGDFWCFPAIIMAMRLVVKTDTNAGAMDRFLRGFRSVSAEEFRKMSSDKSAT